MEDNREKILQYIREKGPVLPVDIAKQINSNILMASAHLSELSSNSKLKISNIKIGGGSPLYYLPGQEAQLQKFADNLNEKEKRAYDLLYQKKILRDSQLEPLYRVTLRAIKDFAVPLQVNYKGSSEIFWRWYLLTNKEAEESIREILKATATKPENEITEKEPKEKIIEKKTEKKIKKEVHQEDTFSSQISDYFNKNKINILSKEIIRKTEIDFTIQVPSNVGNLDYYCKTKNKKKINDADLSSAFAQGQLRKLPVILLTNGDLTKRAKEMLQKDFKGMNIIHI